MAISAARFGEGASGGPKTLADNDMPPCSTMSRAASFFVPFLLLALAACAEEPSGAQQSDTSTAAQGQQQPGKVKPPKKPKPVADGPCPYLDEGFVAGANGQHVGSVKTSKTKPHPACFFYRPDGGLQLTVQVYVGKPAKAKALVDKAAPVATSNPADSPAGWKGGAESNDDGAVYAVAKGGTAVVVTTNQGQTIKARRITEETITSLGL